MFQLVVKRLKVLRDRKIPSPTRTEGGPRGQVVFEWPDWDEGMIKRLCPPKKEKKVRLTKPNTPNP